MSEEYIDTPSQGEDGTVPPGAPHAESCEADQGHAADCATATRLARLVAFAEAVRDEVECTEPEADDNAKHSDVHIADCFHCAAEQALEPVR